ncbi:MAG: hypothetical protein U0163_10555 [Gemmatimonadaceae bacterium]
MRVVRVGVDMFHGAFAGDELAGERRHSAVDVRDRASLGVEQPDREGFGFGSRRKSPLGSGV